MQQLKGYCTLLPLPRLESNRKSRSSSSPQMWGFCFRQPEEWNPKVPLLIGTRVSRRCTSWVCSQNHLLFSWTFASPYLASVHVWLFNQTPTLEAFFGGRNTYKQFSRSRKAAWPVDPWCGGVGENKWRLSLPCLQYWKLLSLESDCMQYCMEYCIVLNTKW